MVSRAFLQRVGGLAAAMATPCLGQIYIASFDKLTEGNPTTQLTEGGMTFLDLDQRIPGSPPPFNFVIENASSTLAGQPGFSSPNTLSFTGYSPGPGAAFSRFGSMRIVLAEVCVEANIHVYEFLTGVGNSIVFAGYRNGVEVVRDTLPIIGGGGVHHYELNVEASILGGFDELRLLGVGPIDQGVFFGLVDTVTARVEGECYTNCDGSTTPPVLNVADFACFLQRFALADPYANCDGSTVAPVLNISDFSCFLSKFAAGCE
jgi:hypothetical protein